MRTPILVCGILLLTLLAPSASAATATLQLVGPTQAVAAGEAVPITVRLHIEDFLCQQPRTFEVQLEVRGDGQASGVLAPATARFEVPAKSYFLEDYDAERVVNMTVGGSGRLQVFATFAPPEGTCFTPGGFQPAFANLTIDVQSGAVAPPAQTPPATPPAEANGTTNGTATNGTYAPPVTNQTEENATSPSEGNATTPTPATSAPTPAGVPPTCPPDTSCGYIGDFEGNAVAQESTGGNNDVPAPAAVALLAAIGAAAILLRKR